MLVVDASAVVCVLTDRGALGAAARSAVGSEPVAAPHLIDAEVMSGLRQENRSGGLSEAGLSAAIGDYLALPIERWASTVMVHRISELRHNLTAYDATYVALAEALDATLLTLDGRLARAPGPRCEVVLVGA